jgi:NAD(P)-dependent dehydrogenase (short-subunit alcohol dehydrogenase family)
MLAVTGRRSAIVEALLPLLPEDEAVGYFSAHQVTTRADRYLFCAGVLVGKRIGDQSWPETAETFRVNFDLVARACEAIFASNGRARVCVIGSESGISGSYDAAYGASKAALHHYVETKRLNAPGQQLVAIAPSIIADAGMTTRRSDLEQLEARRRAHPKKRFLRAVEVARLVHHVLYVDEGYLSGVVIRMNGGQQ